VSDAVSVVNQALLAVGADPITTFGDETTESKVAAVRYAPIKRAFLRSYPWNCATRRVALTEYPTPPISGFDKQFNLPPNSVRILQVWAGDMQPEAYRNGERAYSIEGSKLLINETAVSVVYVEDIPEAEFDSHVEEALVAKLAFEFSYTFVASNTTQQQFSVISEAKLQEARTTDSLENPATILRIDGLTRVRH